MAFTLGQHPTPFTTTTVASPQTFTLAYGSNVTSGNLLIAVSAAYSPAATISTGFANSGTAGAQTWHALLTTPFQSSTDNATIQMWYALASSTGSCTCTVSWSASPLDGGELYVSEWSGTSISGSLTQDGSGQHSDGTTASIVLPSITTTFTDDLVFGYVSSANTGTVVSPWVQVAQASGDEWFYQADLSASTYTPHVTQTSGTYACVMAAVGIPSAATGIPDLIMGPPHR
jgi:hypothetical protein